MKHSGLGIAFALALLPTASIARADDAVCITVSVGAHAAPATPTQNVGQTVIGESDNGVYAMQAGVLYCFAANPIPADCDADGDVDLADFLLLEQCLLGPGAPYGGVPADCNCIDLDADNDLDLQDFQLFQAYLTQ